MPLIPHKQHHFDGVRLQLATGFDAEWIPAMWKECVTGTTQRTSRWQLPDEYGTAVFVKVYRRRPSHGLLRRLLPGRAQREGLGYIEFSNRGIDTIPLLAWGEERYWGLWERGVVVTKAVDAKTVEEEFSTSEDTELLFDTSEQLARIHGVGLSHGDPLVRNFLATRPVPTPFDLPSWSRLSRSSQRRDLIRFLGSIASLTGCLEMTADLLSRYSEQMAHLPQSEEDLLEEAQKYALEKKQT
ncbi:MAG: hypothetical protein COB10_03410 [Planctomycetota bacterium]|mgnify:CR=1 FL=1|nr:MAG: hypothetical protein COB10_03410 [Planctomycetota bacterium]